jgi:cytochrome c-type biogenesis protein CcmH
MTSFWVYAALLTAAALAILVTPLVRGRGRSGAPVSRAASNLTVFRDQLAELDADLAAGTIGQDQWEAARADLQRGLLEDAGAGDAAPAAPAARSKAAAIVVLAAVPLLSVSMYLLLGSPHGLNPERASAAPAAPHELSQQQIESMVASLAKRLEANPDDADGWIMLARTYGALGHFDKAAGAYAKAEALFPQNAQLLADYADSLAMTQGQSLQGKPEALIRRALDADGNNLKALALAGSVEFEKQNFAKAAEFWKRILPLLPADSKMQDSVHASIKEAEGKLGGVSGAAVATAQAAQGGKPPAANAKAAAGAARLSGTIKLAPALAARAAPEDTVFVLARPAKGSRMPLAAVRVQVKDLPLEFSFDDSMAMSAAAKLSDFAEVVVAARVSKSGNVMPERGDLEGVSKPVPPRTSGMSVEIAKEVQ